MNRSELFLREMLLSYPSKITEHIAGLRNISIKWVKEIPDSERNGILKLNSERKYWKVDALKISLNKLSPENVSLTDSTFVGFVNHDNLIDSPPLYSRPTYSVLMDRKSDSPGTPYYFDVSNEVGSIVIELVIPDSGNQPDYDLVEIEREIKKDPLNKDLLAARNSILNNIKGYLAKNLSVMIALS